MSDSKGVGDMALGILSEGVTKTPNVPDVSDEAIEASKSNVDRLITEMIQETTTTGSIGVNLAGPGKKGGRRKSKDDLQWDNALGSKRPKRKGNKLVFPTKYKK